ncbi:HD domain-containing protein [Selenomonas dianae]|uniref:HD domain-containing protein n=1 Tax=Selenomonas dianae TaxID=135079 RepID=A0ABN0SXQ0_9FIRM|nr:HD domain-containing protein [Selenomonas dianae]WLD83014.1 HD domain-containing protein [Selenomonas dianae]
MDALLHEMHTWMNGYMRSFRTDDSDVMRGIHLKEIHTGYVTANARALAKYLGCTAHDTALAEIIGLFHDVGRFRQYAVYRTFNDAVSEDHADLGLHVLNEGDFLKRLSPSDADAVCFAIRYHNKKEIAPTEDRRKLFFAKLIRDADKLDIYRVLLPFLTADGAEKAPNFVPSDAAQEVSPDFIADFAAGGQADYYRLRTHGDRKIVRLLWIYDINFAWTLRRIVARGYVEAFTESIPKQEGIAEGVARMRAYIERRCAQEDTLELYG